MKINKFGHRLRGILLLPTLLLSGCSMPGDIFWFLHPNGPIASASLHYLTVDVLLLLIVIVPATSLVVWTVWRYRRSGGHANTYDPKFTHSYLIEIVIWGVPLAIVAILGYFSCQGVFALDPYNPRALNDGHQAANSKPLKIDVITTDWQWLFVYPEQDIAVSNKLVVPVGRKIQMRLTSASVTNDFYILKIVGQIYVMPGMRTKQHFRVDRAGDYRGFSTEFSGPGFSWMNYTMHAVSPSDFEQWVKAAQRSGTALSYGRFVKFAKPTVNVGDKSQLFHDVDPNLFRQIIENVKSGKLTHEKPIRMTEDMHSALFRQHAN